MQLLMHTPFWKKTEYLYKYIYVNRQAQGAQLDVCLKYVCAYLKEMFEKFVFFNNTLNIYA